VSLSRRHVLLTAPVVAALAACTVTGSAHSTPSPTGSVSSSPAATASPTPTSTLTAQPSTTAGAPVLGEGQVGTLSQVPWSQVGPGWVLVAVQGAGVPVDGVLRTTVPARVDLADPVGGRYVLLTLPPAIQSVSLVGWSGDGRLALLHEDTTLDAGVSVGGSSYLLRVRTGTQTPLPLPPAVSPAGFTLPHGAALLTTTPAPQGATSRPTAPWLVLQRRALDGTLEATLAPQVSSWLYTPDGTQLVVTTPAGIELVTNSGVPVRALADPGYCELDHWWAAGQLLASCAGHLWLIPASGAPATPLIPHDAAVGSTDLGDTDAWRLPDAVYTQSDGACALIFLGRVNAAGTVTVVTLPHATAPNSIVDGAVGDRLLVQARLSCEGSSHPAIGQFGEPSVLWFNPVTGAETLLERSPATAQQESFDAQLFG